MQRDEWPKVKLLLVEAVGLDAVEQERLVRDAYPRDPAFQREVLELLSNYTLATLSPIATSGIVQPATRSTVRAPENAVADLTPPATGTAGLVLEPGDMCGRYQVVRPLGHGGMGQVYLADDTELTTRVALKVLSDQWLESSAARTRLRREARHAAGLRGHRHIATLLDFIEVEMKGRRFPVLVLEYVEGTTARAIVAEGPVPLLRALRWAAQIADAIEYAHDRGVLHCDLKPANVQITPEDEVKLLDFGIARAVYSRTDPSEGVLGTPAYMAPEQITEGRFSEAGDVYGLGVALFELVTGRRPFESEYLPDLLAEIVGAPPPRASALLAGASPPELDVLFERALAKSPRQRHQSVSELRRDLAVLIEKLDPAAAATPAASRARQYLGTLVLAAGALTLLGFTTSWMLDMALGRTREFKTESAWTLPLWGGRSVLPELVFIVFWFIGWIVTREAFRLALGLPPVRRTCGGLVAAVRARIDSIDPLTIGRSLLLTQVAALSAFVWYFWPLLAAVVDVARGLDDAPLRMLWRGDDAVAAYHDWHAYLLTAQLFFFSGAWLALWPRLRRRWAHERTLLVGAAITTALTVMLIPPKYRLVHHNDGERVTYGTETCYLVGQTDARGLLFCPLAAHRRAIVPLGDPDLRRSGVVEEVYEAFNAAP